MSESPAYPSDKRGQQDHKETLQIKLSGLEGEHEQTAGYQQHHEDQEWVLLGSKESDKHQTKKGGKPFDISRPNILFE